MARRIRRARLDPPRRGLSLSDRHRQPGFRSDGLGDGTMEGPPGGRADLLFDRTARGAQRPDRRNRPTVPQDLRRRAGGRARSACAAAGPVRHHLERAAGHAARLEFLVRPRLLQRRGAQRARAICWSFARHRLLREISVGIDTEAGRHALDYMRKLLAISPPNVLDMDWDASLDLFMAGEAAMAYCWSMRAARLEYDVRSRVKRRVRYLPQPAGPNGSNISPLGGFLLAVPANLPEERVDGGFRGDPLDDLARGDPDPYQDRLSRPAALQHERRPGNRRRLADRPFRQ